LQQQCHCTLASGTNRSIFRVWHSAAPDTGGSVQHSQSPSSRRPGGDNSPCAFLSRIASQFRGFVDRPSFWLQSTAIARRRQWLDDVVSGRVTTVAKLCAREKCSVRQVNLTISLAFLAPNLVKSAIEGRLPRGIDVERLREYLYSGAALS